jgi:hypothetical protein
MRVIFTADPFMGDGIDAISLTTIDNDVDAIH